MNWKAPEPPRYSSHWTYLRNRDHRRALLRNMSERLRHGGHSSGKTLQQKAAVEQARERGLTVLVLPSAERSV